MASLRLLSDSFLDDMQALANRQPLLESGLLRLGVGGMKVFVLSFMLAVSAVSASEPKARLYINGEYERIVTAQEFMERWSRLDDLPIRTFLCTEPADSDETPCKFLKPRKAPEGQEYD